MRKLVAVTMALTLGFTGVPTSFAQTEPAVKLTKEAMYEIQIEQQVNGVVTSIYDYEMNIKGDDGRNYAVILSYFTREEIEKMGIKEGAKIFVEGQALPKEYAQSFAYYKLSLPTTLSADELAKVETHFEKMKELDSVENYQASAVEWDAIYEILQPHFYLNWEPAPFEEMISWYPFEISTEDRQKLETIYQESVALIIEGNYLAGQERMSEFYQVIDQYYQDYYVRPTFAEYIEQIEFEFSAADLAELERLYDEIDQLEQSGEKAGIDDLWHEFHLIIEEYYLTNYEPPTFEDFISQHEFSISDSDIEKLRPLYEQIIQLEKDRKWEESSAVWEQIHEVLTPYYEFLKPIYFQASQVIVR